MQGEEEEDLERGRSEGEGRQCEFSSVYVIKSDKKEDKKLETE